MNYEIFAYFYSTSDGNEPLRMGKKDTSDGNNFIWYFEDKIYNFMNLPKVKLN